MQDNTKPDIPEDFSENEKPLTDKEGRTPQENTNFTEPGFEEQEGELLPPDEKKKSGTGKLFLYIILVLASLGGYLYFNKLIPSEILNIVFKKSAPSMPPALITQTPYLIDKTIEDTAAIAEPREPVEIIETTIIEPATVSPEPTETQETHISGYSPAPTVSGKSFGQTTKEHEIHLSGYATIPAISASHSGQMIIEEEPRKAVMLDSVDSIVEQEVIVEHKFIEEPVTDEMSVSEPASQKQDESLRSKAVKAYLDFIESSLQKLVELTKETFELSWKYLKGKLSFLNPTQISFKGNFLGIRPTSWQRD